MQGIINFIRNLIRYFDEAEEIKEKLNKEKGIFNKKNIPLFIPRLRMYKKREEIEKFFNLGNKAQNLEPLYKDRLTKWKNLKN